MTKRSLGVYDLSRLLLSLRMNPKDLAIAIKKFSFITQGSLFDDMCINISSHVERQLVELWCVRL